MRHFILGLLVLVAGGFPAMAQGFITFTNTTGIAWQGATWIHTVDGEDQDVPLALETGPAFAWQYFTVTAEQAAYPSSQIYIYGPDVSTVYAGLQYADSGLHYLVDVGHNQMDVPFNEVDDWPSLVVQVPEPSTGVFFCLGATTLLLLSKHPRKSLRGLVLGASQPLQCLPASSGSVKFSNRTSALHGAEGFRLR